MAPDIQFLNEALAISMLLSAGTSVCFAAPRNMDRKTPETTLLLALCKRTSAFLARHVHDKPLVMHFSISLVIQLPLMNGICCPEEMAEPGQWSLASSFLEEPRF